MLIDILASPYVAFAPSNIALVKYWGKTDESLQWPANDSLSMTFSELGTATGVAVLPETHKDHEVSWQGHCYQRAEQGKIFTFLDFLTRELNREGTKLKVVTANNFPSDAGIASSASGFAALCLAAVASLLEAKTLARCETKGWGLTRIANLARMGSGSACRSLHGGFVHWQRGDSPTAQSVAPLPSLLQLSAFILIVDPEKKLVSSRDAHRLAPSSPLFKTRVSGIAEKIGRFTAGLSHGDFATIGPEIEQEALEMHCVAMTSHPAVHYLKSESWQILQALRDYRQLSKIPAYATIDAGPNIHVLTPKPYKDAVHNFLLKLPHRQLLVDETGLGAQLSPDDGFLVDRFGSERKGVRL